MNGQPQSMGLKWVKYIDASTVYAVGDRGCFMKSTDGGDTWLINSQAGPSDKFISIWRWNKKPQYRLFL
ncbi:MAG: hypothetical protein R2942_16965 [Ignavibacteria bacterium]